MGDRVLVAKTEMTVAEVLQERIMGAFANGCADLQAVGYLGSQDILSLGLGFLDDLRGRLSGLDGDVAAEDLVSLAALAKRVRKKAIPYKKTPLADADEEWDAASEVAAAEVDALKVMCAIVQGEGEAKKDYKLPHHKAAGKHACVLAGVQAAGNVLQGGRGGIDASDAEIAGARKHLARHYKEFDEVPPWEKEGGEKGEGGGTAVAVSKPGFDESETEIRYRLRDPGDFRDDTFRTKKWEGITGEGLSFEVTDAMANSVSMILAKLKPEIAEEEGRSADSMVMQSVRWAKVDEDGEETGWTLARAKEWWGEQGKREKHTMLGDLPHDERHLDELGRPYLPARPQKVRKSLYVQILRKNEARQLVTGVVLPCNRVDLQADFVEREQLLDTAIQFMERSQVMNLMHEDPAPKVKIVESYLAPVDFELGGFEIKEGYWIMTVHVIDAELWKRVQDGEFNGFSIEGIAQRIAVAEDELPDYVDVTEEARAAALLQAA